MLMQDLTDRRKTKVPEHFAAISSECSQYLAESDGLPLMKVLSSSYAIHQKIKVRYRHDNIKILDEAFKQQCKNISQRAVFTYTASPDHIAETDEPYYVFPTNGYRYVYDAGQFGTSKDYQIMVTALLERLENQTQAYDIVADLLRYNCCSTQLRNGVSAGANIIIYSVPHYFAIKQSAYPNYAGLYTQLTKA